MTGKQVLLYSAEARAASARRGGTFLLDTWAWFEVFEGTPAGRDIAARYLATDGLRILTADVSLAEASAALVSRGQAERSALAVDFMIEASDEVVAIGRDDALLAGPLRAELRKAAPNASLADAILLAVARNRGATLVSCDPAFEGQPDVICKGRTHGPRRSRKGPKKAP